MRGGGSGAVCAAPLSGGPLPPPPPSPLNGERTSSSLPMRCGPHYPHAKHTHAHGKPRLGEPVPTLPSARRPLPRRGPATQDGKPAAAQTRPRSCGTTALTLRREGRLVRQPSDDEAAAQQQQGA